MQGLACRAKMKAFKGDKGGTGPCVPVLGTVAGSREAAGWAKPGQDSGTKQALDHQRWCQYTIQFILTST